MSASISGFMPIPLALMIPFMATQSIVMGEAFGVGFQYGKRRISAMPNEEFNKLKMEDIVSKMFKTYEKIIPDLKVSMDKSTDLQNFIVSKLLDMPRELLDAWFHAIHGHGGADPHPSDTPPGTTPPGFVPNPDFDDDPDKFTPPDPHEQRIKDLHISLDVQYKKLDDHIETQQGIQRGLNDPSSARPRSVWLKEHDEIEIKIIEASRVIQLTQQTYKNLSGNWYNFKAHHTFNYL